MAKIHLWLGSSFFAFVGLLLFQNCSPTNFSTSQNQLDSASTVADVRQDKAGDVQPSMLVHKYFGNPILNVRTGNEPSWRSTHVANASIIGPTITGDGRWKMYLRGSGWRDSELHDQIGLFYQEGATFSPFGPWQEDTRNPILRNGGTGSYDEKHLLDVSVLKGAQDIYLYYKSVDKSGLGTFSGAVSRDHGQNFTKFGNNPMKAYSGPSDVIFNGDQYYFYYGSNKWNPLTGTSGQRLQIMESKSGTPNAIGTEVGKAVPAGASGSYDSAATNGAKIFKVPGDKRWFMVYQVSAINFDYPERIHVAYSNDLLFWTKVTNPQPFMLRGEPGEWDQGGIWTSDVIVHNSILYLYYEGWGSFENDLSKRDTPYYPGGNSRLGAVSVSVQKFLDWVNGAAQIEGPVFQVQNAYSGKFMDVAGYIDSNGTNIQQWPFADADNQKFEFTKNLDGSYLIRPLFSNRCVDVTGGSLLNFANVHLWDYWGGANQKWLVHSVGKDIYAIINAKSGMALEVLGGRTENGANIDQYTYFGYSNQKWRLVRVR